MACIEAWIGYFSTTLLRIIFSTRGFREDVVVLSYLSVMVTIHDALQRCSAGIYSSVLFPLY